MADNIRPALYGARYSALPVAEPQPPAQPDLPGLGGPFCESSDVLAEGHPLARDAARRAARHPGQRGLPPEHGQQL